MNYLHLRSWYYEGVAAGESNAREFFEKLQEGTKKGVKFPFDCPFQVALVHCSGEEHWCVGVLVLRGTTGDDSIEQSDKLNEWYELCQADPSGTVKDCSRALHPTVEATLQARYGNHYQSVKTFDRTTTETKREATISQQETNSILALDSPVQDKATEAASYLALEGTIASIEPLASKLNLFPFSDSCADAISSIYKRLTNDDDRDKVAHILIKELFDGASRLANMSAARALTSIADPRTTPTLIYALLKSAKLSSQSAASHVLAKLGDARAIEPLLFTLINAYKSPTNVGSAMNLSYIIIIAESLASIASPETVCPLFEKYKSENPRAVEQASEAYLKAYNEQTK